MNQDSKEVLSPSDDDRYPVKWRIQEWIDDHNPLPYSLRFWWDDHDIFHPLRVWRKLKNVVRWVPVLWDDVDWDYSSLYSILHFKLKNMRESHEKWHNHTDWEEIVAQIKTAEDCMSRLVKDTYAADLWATYHATFSRSHEWVTLENGMRQMSPMSDEQHASLKKIFEEEERQLQADIKLFTDTFSQNVRGWWD